MENTVWLQKSKKRIFFDMHLPDWPEKGVASNFDVDYLSKKFCDCGADSVVLYAKCQYGNFYYDTKIGHKHRGLGELDLFGSLSKCLIQNGINVIAYYSVAWDQYLGTTNPDWQVESYEGIKGNSLYRWKTLCINSPYRNLIFEHLSELFNNYHFNGLWLDMTIVGTERCYCKYCRQKYLREKNEEMPSPNSEKFPGLIKWQYDYVEEFYKEIRSLCKSLNKEVAICNNYWGYPYSVEGMSGRAIGSLNSADYVTGEAYSDWTGLNAQSFFSKFLRGASYNRPFEVLIGRFLNTWDFTYKSPAQMELETATIIANGGTVTIDDEPFYDGSIDEELYEKTIKEVFDQVDRRKEYFQAQPVKYAAIYYSQYTKDISRNDNDSFIKDIAGSFKLLRDAHVPFDFIFDENLPELTGYALLILPNVKIIPEHNLVKIKDFIMNGGTVISFGNFGQGIQPGKTAAENDLIKKVFGVKSTDISDYSISYYMFNNRPCLVEGRYVKYSTDSEWEAYDEIIDPICETSREEFFHNHLPAPYKPSGEHAFIKRDLGKGKIILFPQLLSAQYARKTQTQIIDIVTYCINKYAKKAPINFVCPKRVDVSVMETDDKFVIHFINPNPGLSVCCGLMETFESDYKRTFEYMDEIIPVYNIGIELEGKYTRAYTVDKPDNFSIEIGKNKTKFVIKALEIWETIVISKF